MKQKLYKSWPHIVAVLLILLVNVIYFYPQLEGKKVSQNDIVSSDQASQVLKEYKEQGLTYLWNPSQFAGMPVLAGAPSQKNYSYWLYDLLRLGINEPIGLYFAGSIMTYIMFILLGLSPWTSLALSCAAVLSTGNVILWEAGHNSKIRTLIFTPLLISGVLLIFEKRKYLIGFLVLSLGFALSLYTRHPQMTYYIMLIFLIYGIIVLVDTIKNKNWRHFGIGTALVFASLLLGLGTSASKVWSMYDYSSATMRGEAILSSEASGTNSSSNVEGLTWDYAMNWSNGWKDIMATYIPGFAGGGSSQKVENGSSTFKAFRISNAPIYWGTLPWTVGPLYIGAVVWFLFLFGLLAVKGRVKWWLGLGTLWAILISMGSNAAILNRTLFDIMPFFSKFRAPSSMISAATVFVVLLAGLGLKELVAMQLSKKKKANTKLIPNDGLIRPLLITTGVAVGIPLLFLLLGGSIFDFTGPGDATLEGRGIDIAPFVTDRKALFYGDLWRTLFIVLAVGGLSFAFLKGKLSKYILLAGVGLICLGDLLTVDFRYLDYSKYKNAREARKSLAKRPVDEQILQIEKDRSKYRVMDLTINTFNSSEASAHHNTIGGYDPAKMQRYQDLIDQHIVKNNQEVYNMLNTKYFILNGENSQPRVQQNPNALGPAWFVREIVTVNSPDEEIAALSNFKAKDQAVVLKNEFSNVNVSVSPGSEKGTITMTSYEPDVVTYQTSNGADGLAVFSEMWYGPDKGWQAYIDGQRVEHIRANYTLRALPIPAGSHEIRFEFKPKSFYRGETISMLSSILLLGIVIGVPAYKYYEEKKKEIANTE